jgi:wyosine [tRNA(Phe)-imidazoG37] synthetase (radical SAM superfamily)
MMTKNKSIYKQLHEYTRGRDVYIWGAGYYGVSLYRKCKEHQIEVKGFVDKNPLLENTRIEELAVFSLAILKKYKNKKPFLILAAPMATRQMESYCAQNGLEKDKDFYSTKNNIEFIVDISGSCNLVCPSCPRGNSPRNTIKGFMDVELFKKVVDKILIDEPGVPCLALFNWGEPFLHPNLSECIGYLKEKNIYSVVSSNMSIEKSIDAALRADPDWLKVSLSGYYQEVYATTHTGGNINLVKSNLYRIRYLIDKYKLTTKVEIRYHRYLNNIGEDLEKMQELCKELDFALCDIVAYFQPLERIIDYHEHKPVRNLEKLRSLFIDKKVYEVREERRGEERRGEERRGEVCSYQTNQITIDCNGKLQLCCAVYDDINNFDMDYLTTSVKEITEKKLAHDFCKKCKRYGLSL